MSSHSDGSKITPNMAQLIHVKIGNVDGVYPVRNFFTEGAFKDVYEYQVNTNTIGWVHKRWCTPVETASNDTDWRAYLKAHWDNVHNHCRVDALAGFMEIFDRAAAAYRKKIQTGAPSKVQPVPKRPAPSITVAASAPKKPTKPHYVELSLFD